MKGRFVQMIGHVKFSVLCSALVASLALSGCAREGWLSPDAGIGTLLGAGAGGGIAAAVGETSADAVLAAAAGGAALGLVAGKSYNEHRIDEDPDTMVHVIRRPNYSKNLTRQKEIDALSEQIHESGKWGRSETKPWNERYRGEESDYPYEGGVGE